MDVEYGVKTENKFLLSDFDVDDPLDPSDILKRLQASNDKLLSSKPKKVLPVQKTATVTTIKSKTGDKLTTNEKPRQIRPTDDKENILRKTNDRTENTQSFQPRRTAFGSRGLPRNRLPKQERSDLPPRFRQPDDPLVQSDKNDSAALNNASDNIEFGAQGKKTENANDHNFGAGFGSGFGGANDEQRRFSGRGRGRGIGRDGIGGFRGDRSDGGYRRQFDRQSGSDRTGIKAVDKRDGHGAHNWGSTNPQDLAADAVDQMDTSLGAQQPAEQEADAGDANTTNVTHELAADEEAAQITLDEYRAKQRERAQPQFNVRRAGEGDKNPAWDKLKPLKHSDVSLKSKISTAKKDMVIVLDENDDELDAEDDSKIVPINIRFIGEAPRRGGRGRGGPGGRGRGGFEFQERRDASAQFSKPKAPAEPPVPYVIDEQSFPSLH